MPSVTNEKKCSECGHTVKIEIENGPYIETDGESWWHSEDCSQYEAPPQYDTESMSDAEYYGY